MNLFKLLVYAYNLNIEPSYISFKSYLSSKWPYMNKISNTKSEYCNIDNTKCKIMSSYSYLGNHANPETQHAAVIAAMAYSSGSHGPRMLLGNTDLFQILETKLSKFYKKEAAIVTNSGYMASLGAIPVIADENSVIYYDARCHDSLMSGMKLSNAKLVKFSHNNFDNLEKKLSYSFFNVNKKIVVIESLYSMDGTIPDLYHLKKLKNKYNLIVVIDEAHGLGTLGPTGRGVEEYYNIDVSDVIVGTFSKSLSNLGGFITGSSEFIQKCEYYSQANVFTAGLSAYHVAGATQALSVLDNKKTIMQLKENTKYMREKLNNIAGEMGFKVGGHKDSVVIPIIYKYDVLRIIDICHEMKKMGYAIAPVLPPACSIYTPRFRITATSWYTKKTIDDFIDKFVIANRIVDSKLDLTKIKKVNQILNVNNYLYLIFINLVNKLRLIFKYASIKFHKTNILVNYS